MLALIPIWLLTSDPTIIVSGFLATVPFLGYVAVLHFILTTQK